MTNNTQDSIDALDGLRRAARNFHPLNPPSSFISVEMCYATIRQALEAHQHNAPIIAELKKAQEVDEFICKHCNSRNTETKNDGDWETLEDRWFLRCHDCEKSSPIDSPAELRGEATSELVGGLR